MQVPSYPVPNLAEGCDSKSTGNPYGSDAPIGSGNVKDGSEFTKGAGRSMLTPPGLNLDTTPSGVSSMTCPVSDKIQFVDCTLQPSRGAALPMSGSGWSLVSIPRNMLLEKVHKDVMGDLY